MQLQLPKRQLTPDQSDGTDSSSPSVVLHGSVKAAPPNSRGFDTDTALNSSSARALAQQGFQFAIRYLSLGTPESSGDLTSGEAQEILTAGLALMAVQHVLDPGWMPTASLGTQNGLSAAANAASAGLPAGIVIWLDLEGVSSAASPSAAAAYCNAWAHQVSAARYIPGLYIGYACGLNSDELAQVSIEYFWKSGSSATSQSANGADYLYPANGYCLVQSISSGGESDGVAYDNDLTRTDNAGKTPLWLAPGKPDPAPPAALPPHSENKSGGNARSLVRVLLLVLAAGILYAAGVLTAPWIHPQKPLSGKATSTTRDVAVPPTEPAPAPAVPSPPPADSTAAGKAGSQVVIAASFSNNANADNLAEVLRSGGFKTPSVKSAVVKGQTWYAVRLGPYDTPADAAKVSDRLREKYRLQPSVVQLTSTRQPDALPPPQ